MLKSLFLALLSLVLSLNTAHADVQWIDFSFQFGGSTLDVNGNSTYGSGFSATTSLFHSENSGYLINVGASHTEASSGNFFGNRVTKLEIDNRYIQPGYFHVPFKGLKLAVGPSFNWVDQKIVYATSSDDQSRSFLGPFFTVSYRLPIQTLVLGAQYNYVRFGDYTQSDLFFLIGLAF